jgi:hypothetical protein
MSGVMTNTAGDVPMVSGARRIVTDDEDDVSRDASVLAGDVRARARASRA